MARKRSSKKIVSFEEILHITFHAFGIVFLYWAMLVPPLWLSFVVLIIEYMQMKMLGNCFLTVVAHKRGFMKGKSYWSHVFYRLNVKKYKQADERISLLIKITLVGIPLYRLVIVFL